MKFAQILQPGTIGNLKVPNRIVMPPMETNFGTGNGSVTERHEKYYEARAKGGVGLIIVEAISVEFPRGNTVAGNLALDDDSQIPGFNRLTKAIKKHGARVAAQLFHAGAEAHKTVTGTQPVGPSPVRTFKGDLPKELSLSEISYFVHRFASAAHRAKRAGFDAVEIHGGTYYLIAQFLSRHWNKRQDSYGGILENRARFLLEIIGAVKDAVGLVYPVWCRINGAEFGLEEGITIAESKQIAQLAEMAGSDAIHLTSFGRGSQAHMGPTVIDPGILLPIAQEIKQGRNIPIIVPGRIDPFQGERAISDNQADFISIGRGLITDPELPNKLAEDRYEDIRPCICCLQCINHAIFKNDPLMCSVNALCGNEKEASFKKSVIKKKIAVVGGGPGGMEAARVLALRGHQVALYEKQPYLGGLLIPASIPPRKEDIKRFIYYLTNQIQKLDIEVRLGREIRPGEVESLHPDAIVVACGAEPCFPNINGIENLKPLTAEEALVVNAISAEKILIIGGGTVGCETADYFSDMGRHVTIIEILPKMAHDLVPILRRGLLDRLKKKSVNMFSGVKQAKFEAKKIIFDLGGGKETVIETDLVIIAAGRISRQEQWKDLKIKFKNVFFVGDVANPRGILEAVSEGNHVGRNL